MNQYTGAELVSHAGEEVDPQRRERGTIKEQNQRKRKKKDRAGKGQGGAAGFSITIVLLVFRSRGLKSQGWGSGFFHFYSPFSIQV